MMRMTCRPCCDTRAPPRDGETKVIESETRIKGRSDATNAMVTLAVVIACYLSLCFVTVYEIDRPDADGTRPEPRAQ